MDKYIVTTKKGKYYVEMDQRPFSTNPRKYDMDNPKGMAFIIQDWDRENINDLEDERCFLNEEYEKCDKNISKLIAKAREDGKQILPIHCVEQGNVTLSFESFGPGWEFNSWECGIAILDKGVSYNDAKLELGYLESYENGEVYSAWAFDYETGRKCGDEWGAYYFNPELTYIGNMMKIMQGLEIMDENETAGSFTIEECKPSYDFEKDVLKRRLSKYEDIEMGE